MRLIFNACEGNLQLLLTNNNVILCAQDWTAPNSSTEILSPAIAEILNILSLVPEDINAIACVNGPGSFTGIRLTLGTAAAMRRVLNIPVAGINYLQALALTAHIYLSKQIFLPEINYSTDSPNPNTKQCICYVLSHAKRNIVHAQFYEFKANSHELSIQNAHELTTPNTQEFAIPNMISDISIFSIEDICKQIQIQSASHKIYCLGSGLIRNFTLIKQLCANAHFLAIDKVCNEALNILAQACTYQHKDLEPIYTRQCDALDNLSSIAMKQGFDPDKRHAELEELLQRPVEPSKNFL